MTPLFLHFADEATALSVLHPLLGTFDPPLEGIPRDGEIEGIHVDFDVLFGSGQLAGVPGYHVNALWCGTEESIPEVLQSARVYPGTPACVFG